MERGKPPAKKEWTLLGIVQYVFIMSVLIMLYLWIALAWEASTGLTFASRNRRGRVAKPADIARTRSRAVAATVLVIPLGAAWVFVRRHEQE